MNVKFPTIDDLNKYFKSKIDNVNNILAESTSKPKLPPVVSEFDIEKEADIIYERLLALGFVVERTIQQYGIVTFVIVDEIFITYIDMIYGSKAVKEYIVNVMFKINVIKETKHLELKLSKKTTNVEAIFDILKQKNEIKLLQENK